MPTFDLFRAEGLSPLAVIADGGALLKVLEQVMLGWKMVRVGTGSSDSDVPVRIEQCPDGWRCSGVTFDKPTIFGDPVATACALLSALYKAQTFEDDTSLILHAGGVRLGDGLVLLTGHYNAGKTVFVTACAAAGLQVFSDDIIPLDPNGPLAQAPGLGIRLRLPLPDNLQPATRAFIAEHQVAGSGRYAYLRPPRQHLACRGETASISGVVSLRRVEEGPARMTRLPPADALSETILRNFARETNARVILDTLDSVVASVPCLALTYARSEEAVALLRETFAGGSDNIAEVQPPRDRGGKLRPARAIKSHTRIARAPGVSVRMRGEQAFLTDARELVIFNLNATGSAVWHALAAQMTFGELAATFEAAFPGNDPADISADLSGLVDRLARAGLLILG
jgi:hypothetical protein